MAGKKALEGIKVVDFTWGFVGPTTTKYLADHGATVVKIESHTWPDSFHFYRPFRDGRPGINRSQFQTNQNSSKYGISLDMNQPKAREVAWKLIEWADVVAESFRPGVMKKWGLDYESVRKLKPDIIYFSTCLNGQYGPEAMIAGYGATAAALGGIYHISGWPDRGPTPPYAAFTDTIGPRFGAAAVLAALDHRRRTGQGQYLDQAQTETALPFIEPLLLDYFVNGRVANRNGNRLAGAAPHNVYQCRGEDRWCSIAVFTNEQWKALCEAMGNPDWTSSDKFNTFLGRKRNENELDALVGEWTSKYTAEEVMGILQNSQVPCGVVQSKKDLFEDPQVKHRDHFRYLEHMEIGVHAYDGPAFKLSKTPDSQFAAPIIGQHNEYVCKDILGMSDDEIADLLIEHVITTDADLPQI